MTRPIDDSIRQIANTLASRESLELQQAVKQGLDQFGRATPHALSTLRETQDLQWGPSETARKRAKFAGNIIVVAAHCATPPSTGDATVTITQMSAAGAGQSTTLTIPNGQAIAEVARLVPVRAGAWLASTVTDAQGASGVSTSIVLER